MIVYHSAWASGKRRGLRAGGATASAFRKREDAAMNLHPLSLIVAAYAGYLVRMPGSGCHKERLVATCMCRHSRHPRPRQGRPLVTGVRSCDQYRRPRIATRATIGSTSRPQPQLPNRDVSKYAWLPRNSSRAVTVGRPQNASSSQSGRTYEVRAPVTDEVLTQHPVGEQPYGVYR